MKGNNMFSKFLNLTIHFPSLHKGPAGSVTQQIAMEEALLVVQGRSHYDMSYDPHQIGMLPGPPSIVPPVVIAATTGPLSHRFLLKSENHSLPLCFDVTGDVFLKLLHHPNRELSVNGELDSGAHGGFKRIVIHFKTDQHIQVDTNGITVREGQTETKHTGQDLITVGSVTVIRRDKEIDVTAGDIRMVILIHEEGHRQFLWPVIRQKPSDSSVTGILALKPAVYEEVLQTPLTKLKINNQDIFAIRSFAVDYSIVSSPTLDCWLIPAESALQRPLDNFIASQL
ncbi:uncharacterized protein [Chaetodon trifascialis]|uniref:uncharacterized protein n=1 Tax=Chaetodon trifascialis TaxID=109706 RepID=UPI00399298DB